MTAHHPVMDVARQLIGVPGSRYRLPTPALIVDEALLDANIAAMAQRVRGQVTLRPHAKTHKSGWIAHKQIARGAVGVCCTKLAEAEILSAAGVRGILVTSPTVDVTAPARLCALAQVDPHFMCVADHPEPVTALAAEAQRRNVRVAVLIDVDVGLMRTGVADTADALTLAQHIATFPSLSLAGVQGYGGHWQHIPGAHARRDAVRDGMRTLATVVEALRNNGHPIDLVTGGGTGTVQADLELGVLTEIQPGSYVFMDAEYADALGDDADGRFRTCLWVSSQVVSVNANPIVTVDAGLKAFATDGPAPRPATQPFTTSTYAFYGDEHGAISRPADSSIRLGERVELITPHCDPTVDRYDIYHVVHDDRLVSIIPIDAARASQ